jgi:lysozyme family protein
MAEFQNAFEKTMKFEGGYVFDPSDKGGETVYGISRVNFPKWSGWSVVDSIKKSGGGKKEINASKEVFATVGEFYKKNFWDTFKGDEITDQSAAENIFDFGVNSGTGRAAKYAQRIVGATEDGEIGPKTAALINSYEGDFVAKYKEARLGFLNKIVANNPSQAKFLKGWTSRVENA